MTRPGGSHGNVIAAFANKAVTLPVDADEVERTLDRLEKQRSTGKGNRQRAKPAPRCESCSESGHT